jgi:predicted phage terminase large subunit-like protein
MTVAADIATAEDVPTLDDVALDRALVKQFGLAMFVQLAWGEVEKSSPLVWSWHLDEICATLEAVTRREVRDVVINVPPGCSKSLVVSVLWPAWQWTLDPGHRFIATSYAEKVVLRDAERMRSLVKSAWYRARWPDVEIPSGKAQSDAVGVYRTTKGGMRFSTTVRGQLTGEHCDTMIVDDPIDPLSAAAISGVGLDEIIRWWQGTASTRFRNHARSARVLIMQRVHMRDLAAHMIAEGAHVLCLPMRFEPNHAHRSPRDRRTREGELLVPERIDATEVAKLAKKLGGYGAAAQLQQRPAPEGGGIFKREWFRYWTALPPGGVWSLSVDCAFKSEADSSYVVLQVWYAHGGNFYLVDQRREQMDFPATLRALVAFAAQYPQAIEKLIESKANGPAIVQVLRSKLPGLIEIEPDGGKEVRARAVSPTVESGNVYLPDPEDARYDDGRRGAPWVGPLPPKEPDVETFVGEAITFPRAPTDDQVDTMTQYLNRAAANSTLALLDALAAIPQ